MPRNYLVSEWLGNGFTHSAKVPGKDRAREGSTSVKP